MRGTMLRWSLGFALLFGIAGCGSDDDDSGEGEGEMDATLDILVDAAEGVLNGVHSARAWYLAPGSTSCDALTTWRQRPISPEDFPNRRDPVVTSWDGLGNPHIIAEIANGSSQVLVEVYESEDGTGEPHAAGCEDDVYVAPGARFNTSILVRINP